MTAKYGQGYRHITQINVIVNGWAGVDAHIRPERMGW